MLHAMQKRIVPAYLSLIYTNHSLKLRKPAKTLKHPIQRFIDATLPAFCYL